MKKEDPEPFYTLKQLVAMQVFGTKSVRHLRRVARLQRKDMRRYNGKIEMSWQAVYSYPSFVMEGGEYGLYGSQIQEHRQRKQGHR